jgi:branched-chain amino acid transport system ATP-binding protein
MAALAVDSVSIAFGGVRAVDALSFAVEPGRIKGIIGPNGAGKTTLFNAISGITAPQSGRVLLDDRDITALRPHRRAELGVSRTFQNLQLIPRMSVLENVMLGAHAKLDAGWGAGLLGLARREEAHAEAVAREQLARLGLDGQASRLAGELGFAEAKLLEIARALARTASPR